MRYSYNEKSAQETEAGSLREEPQNSLSSQHLQRKLAESCDSII